ncbi:MAG: amidohydrolase [Chloroflexi bacterium]|nr:amidohydrolase [Chloroflexota bacterium]
MPIYDSDAHISEPAQVFADAYFEPGLRDRRPKTVGIDGRAYWIIDSEIYPRWTGRGCHIMGTPTRVDGHATVFTGAKPESLESLELADAKARLADMDAEDLAVQVIYPSLFLYQPLTVDPALNAAMYRSYHNYLADKLGGHEDRLRWVATVSLLDPVEAARELWRAAGMGACGVMIGGTAGSVPLDHPSVTPFWDAVAETGLPVAVHVAWTFEPLTNFYDHIFFAGSISFTLPVLLGFAAIVGGGLLDRYPNLKVGFFEAGCLWLHFLTDRLTHRFESSKYLREKNRAGAPPSRLPAKEYLKTGRIFVNCEAEDPLLPQVIDLLGEDQVLYASDMPHADRERFNARELLERKDIAEAVMQKILWDNSVRFYGK